MSTLPTCLQCGAANKTGFDYCQWCGKTAPGVDPDKVRTVIPKSELTFSMSAVAAESEWNAQERVDALLRRGIFFSILWLGGIGSAIAVFSAWKARQLIRTSPTDLKGNARVWWCMLVGGAGVLFCVLCILDIARARIYSLS